MSLTLKFFRFCLWLLLSGATAIGLASLGIYLYFTPSLPNPQELRDIELQTPLRVYSMDNKLISEFGEKRRNPLKYEEIPPVFIDALLASEDNAFFEHHGIDVKGLVRAVVLLVQTGEKRAGGSTITMQVAKNYYLSAEKTFTRKFTEILLALKIEQELTKEEILELYINKIYLGKRAYGIEAAAQVYYGKSIHELDLAQIAMIAGLPQAPSAANPINNPGRAIERRNYVLGRMLFLNKISQSQYDQALIQPNTAAYHGSLSEVNAPYVAEMVRLEMVARYGEAAYTEGFKVYTTIDSSRQVAANDALQRGLIHYDHDHGWRADRNLAPLVYRNKEVDWDATLNQWRERLSQQVPLGLIRPAIISRLEVDGAWAFDGQSELWLPFSSMKWARPYLSQDSVGKEPSKITDVVKSGQSVWVETTADGYGLSQLPEVEGALVSLRPNDGAIQALVGGFSPASNQFNRVTQADRQPGSAFKPFIYSAALANGFTPATIINDAPVVFEDNNLESTWRPQNNGGKFFGPTRLRQALYRSQNLVSIRILSQIGPATAIRYITPFGIPAQKLNADLSLALGASAITPMELATAYAVLANGGYAVKPYLISHIEDESGNILFEQTPVIACKDCEADSSAEVDFLPDQDVPPARQATRVMDERTHFLMISMLKDVVKRGTGQRALALNREDLAGKTGTTNDQKDGWFAGFNPDLATIVWVGFDKNRSLGRWAFGSNTALPIWVDYMKQALAGVPEHPFIQPAGIVSVRIDPETGLLAAPDQPNAIFEYFREEDVPKEMVRLPSSSGEGGVDEVSVPEQLF